MFALISHNRNMARRGIPTGINWYLREWMDSLGINQAKMIELTDWSKATMSQLYNNKQDYSPRLVNDAARALNVETWELLMPPARAMAMRRLREDAMRIVEDTAPREERDPNERKSA